MSAYKYIDAILYHSGLIEHTFAEIKPLASNFTEMTQAFSNISGLKGQLLI